MVIALKHPKAFVPGYRRQLDEIRELFSHPCDRAVP